jgi:ketosteroid isomerase-like protein
VNRGDTDGVLSVWADDGVLMPPGHPAVIGKPALEEYFRRLFARSRFHFIFTASHVLIDAATAIERVTYTVETWSSGSALPAASAGRDCTSIAVDLPPGNWRSTCGTATFLQERRLSDRSWAAAKHCARIPRVHYESGEEVHVYDRVVNVGVEGTIVFVIDRGEYSDRFPEEAWAYLGRGFMIEEDDGNLIYYPEPNGCIQLLTPQ